MRGVVAAGHPVTAEAGADVLRAGGNAVDAALAAMFTSFVCRADAHRARRGRLHARRAARGGAGAARLLRRGAGPRAAGRRATHAPLRSVDVDFGDAVQVFHIGAVRGGPVRDGGGRLRRGRALRPAAARRPRRARGGARARAASRSTRSRPTCSRSSQPICAATPESRALYKPAGRPPRSGETHRDPVLADALERLGAEGPAPFYTGDVAAAVCDWVAERGGLLTRADLAAYADGRRASRCGSRYRGADVRHQPAAERGRHPARPRARAARARARAAGGDRARRRDGGRAGRADARVPRRAAGPGLPRALRREPARLDDPHLA